MLSRTQRRGSYRRRDPELERGGGGGNLGKTCTSMFVYVINVYMCIHIQIKQNICRLLLLSNFFWFFFVCLSYYRYSFLVLKIQRGGAAIPVTFLLDQPMFHNVIENKCMSIKKFPKHFILVTCILFLGWERVKVSLLKSSGVINIFTNTFDVMVPW